LHEVLEGLERVLLHDHGGVVALLERARRDRDEPLAPRSTPATRILPSRLSEETGLPTRCVGISTRIRKQVAGREGLLDLLARGA
jgi:hypothetical protein